MNPETILYADLVYVNQAIEIYLTREKFTNYDAYEVDREKRVLKTLLERKKVLEERFLEHFEKRHYYYE